ncbi:flagellar hook protein FlgE [Nitrosomonas oligotropha]|uniref:Flagellar hook protein FlgE n=1 Tax=Nitrosomonas oligotropha TaxID=42354 RepID=A0A2T5I390_9PROT|nr:flagellar hook protein FlgE [Nitrosomonas oligotropha]PTQ78307.1 flagellar hook protein FlgE [Nitrosomonas oligotropha]
MTFQHGLSGLNAASTNLDVIGNNISNANTAGFKQSVAQFSDIFANSMEGTDTAQVGIGSKISSIAQQFGQGTITPTNNPLDIAINGQGFFRMSDNGTVNYSRNGQFHVDDSGFIVDASGANLTGFMADVNGDIKASGVPTNLKFGTSDLAPKATTTFDLGFNLDARKPAISTPFNATNPKTYNSTTSGTVVDSLGNSHVLSLFFQKATATANTWTVFATVDGKVDAAGVPIGVTMGGSPSQSMVFDGDGKLQTIAAAAAVPLDLAIDFSAINPSLGATTPQTVRLDMTTATQFGSDFGVNAITQDGYTSGRMAGFTISADGVILGNYSSGQAKTLGQIVLANFVNPQGLVPVGDGHWAETPGSGEPLVGPPKTGNLGVLQSNAVEDSNVDLTAELVKMIQAQRLYQASAKQIETQDQIIQTITQI